MSPPVREIFADWELPRLLTITIVLFAIVYLRGWLAIRRTRPALFPQWRPICYLLGLAVLWLAIASPIDGFADALLSAHMVEHLLLMSAVPPLVLLGLPVVPLLRGLPRPFTKRVLGPLIRLGFLRKLAHLAVSPPVAWLAMNLSFLLWHVPAAYDFALEHERWHDFEHLCFLGTSFLFWWPILQPWPSRRHRLGWGILLYLLTSDFVNTALSAFLAFCDRPVYSYYVQQPNPFHVSPVSDQAVGAVIMWVVGSIAFLAPAMVLTLRLLQGETRVRAQ